MSITSLPDVKPAALTTVLLPPRMSRRVKRKLARASACCECPGRETARLLLPAMNAGTSLLSIQGV